MALSNETAGTHATDASAPDAHGILQDSQTLDKAKRLPPVKQMT